VSLIAPHLVGVHRWIAWSIMDRSGGMVSGLFALASVGYFPSGCVSRAFPSS